MTLGGPGKAERPTETLVVSDAADEIETRPVTLHIAVRTADASRLAELCKNTDAFLQADPAELQELLRLMRAVLLSGEPVPAPKERKTRALPFTKDNIKRRIDAVREAGLDVTGVLTDGTVLTENRRDKSGLTGKPKLRDAREMLDA
jgi:hypothetical protein